MPKRKITKRHNQPRSPLIRDVATLIDGYLADGGTLKGLAAKSGLSEQTLRNWSAETVENPGVSRVARLLKVLDREMFIK